MENEVHRLEQKLAKLEEDLAQASRAQDVDKIQRYGAAYTATQHELEKAMEQWAGLAQTE